MGIEEWASCARYVFGIIVLHETVFFLWEDLINEWHKTCLQDFGVEVGIHDTAENTHFV